MYFSCVGEESLQQIEDAGILSLYFLAHRKPVDEIDETD
jgi:hypothetical protein